MDSLLNVSNQQPSGNDRDILYEEQIITKMRSTATQGSTRKLQGIKSCQAMALWRKLEEANQEVCREGSPSPARV
ncbi:hypothetical protein [Shewanella algae]|uniref:hypothetical protein n=1 Tax=Shewanella algae TaxID=38313 RepID=UPI000470E3E8